MHRRTLLAGLLAVSTGAFAQSSSYGTGTSSQERSAAPFSYDFLEAGAGEVDEGDALFIGGAELDNNFKLAARNIPNVDVLPIQGINVYDILRRGKLVLSKAAVEALEERFK